MEELLLPPIPVVLILRGSRSGLASELEGGGGGRHLYRQPHLNGKELG